MRHHLPYHIVISGMNWHEHDIIWEEEQEQNTFSDEDNDGYEDEEDY